MSDIHTQKTARQVKDPVCGMIIPTDPSTPKVEHGDHTHSFCSQECKARFEADPKQYHGESR